MAVARVAVAADGKDEEVEARKFEFVYITLSKSLDGMKDPSECQRFPNFSDSYVCLLSCGRQRPPMAGQNPRCEGSDT